MKKIIYLLMPVIWLAACSQHKQTPQEKLVALKKQRSDLDAQIKELEAGAPDTTGKRITPVSVTEIQPAVFTGYVEIQSQISGDDNVFATPKAPGTVKSISVVAGQHVRQGEILALLDASAVEQQIETMTPMLNLQKSVYEKQQNLWAQNIGTEVQLMTAKAQYEATQKQIAALQTQRDMYRIVAPIDGVVDAVNVKLGDFAAPGMSGFRVVSATKLKAEANLGQNYLGKVKQGDEVTLIFPDLNDTMKTRLSYVAQAIDPVSRAFIVQVMLGANSKLHPNMSCNMRISNYQNPKAMIVPVSVIQKTSKGNMLYIVENNHAKSVFVTTGQNSNGKVEILSGLKPGDKVITTGYEEMDNGQPVVIQ
jgi:membrane fusion protein, multidrug efflux system